jgi:K+-sensing histidine kinase KdpD
MKAEFIQLITKIEACTKDIATTEQVRGAQNIESDLGKIIIASTIFKDQFVKLNAQLAQNEPLHSVLSSSQIRHDLRTPLTAILGYSELLIEENKEVKIDNFVSNLTQIHETATQLLLSIDNYAK